jgi:hypothetical protein
MILTVEDFCKIANQFWVIGISRLINDFLMLFEKSLINRQKLRDFDDMGMNQSPRLIWVKDKDSNEKIHLLHGYLDQLFSVNKWMILKRYFRHSQSALLILSVHQKMIIKCLTNRNNEIILISNIYSLRNPLSML